jgi:hypothetical protein
MPEMGAGLKGILAAVDEAGAGRLTQLGELTLPAHFPRFYRQRPRRFAPDLHPGIFVVVAPASCL